MKHAFLSVSLLIFIAFNSIAQNKYPTLDSLERGFATVWKDIKMPCQWVMTPKRKANGRLIFYDTDSTGVQVEFFKASSLPFYTSSQTDFETTEQYDSWKEKMRDDKKSIEFTKIEEAEDAGYIIFKISDGSGEFYRLLARHQDLVCSIRIYNKEMPVEEQLEKLKLLHDLNRK